MKRKIQYVKDVPRWFTYLHHSWNRRNCLKIGHRYDFHPVICDHCGEYVNE